MLVVATILAFFALRLVIGNAILFDQPLVVFIGVLLVAAAGLRAAYPASSGAVLLLRGISVILGAYVAMLWPGFAVPEASSAFYEGGRWFAVLGAALACWRPSFGIIAPAYVLLYKAGVSVHVGFPISGTDYLPVVDLGLFLSVALVVRAAVEPRLKDTAAFDTTLFFTAVAVHFGNYFWSAIAKLRLEAGPFSWLMENETSNLVLVANEIDTLPMGAESAAQLYSAMLALNLPLNLATLVLQLLAVLCVTRRAWTILATFAYDVTHVVIYLASGIFFWKWILLNIVIIYAAQRQPRTQLPVPTQLFLMAVVVVGHLCFFTASLGWYDTAGVVHARYEARASAPGYVAVPSNHFLASSVTAAQMRIGRPHPLDNGAGTWGQTLDAGVWRALNEDCAGQTTEATSSGYEGIRDYVTDQHASLQRVLGIEPLGRVHWYPHHIFANPFRYASYNGLRLSDISGYRVRVESVCLGFENGEFTRDVVATVTTNDWET